MAARTVGLPVTWGIPSAVASALASIKGTGKIQEVEHDEGADMLKHPGETGGTEGKTYFDDEGSVKFTILGTAATVKPSVGDEIVGLGTALGVTGGRILIDKVNRKWATKKGWEMSIQAAHHPEMQ